MRFGFRARIFTSSILLVVVVVSSAGLFLASELRDRLESGVNDQLVRAARATWALMQTGPSDAALDDLADRAGEAVDARITVISANGLVLGDSRLDAAGVAGADNHASRPEVVDALRSGEGYSKRLSATLGTHMLYVAVRFATADGPVIVRAAEPLSKVDAAVARLRRQIVVAGFLGMVIAVFMSALASHWMTGTLSSLAAKAHEIAADVTQGSEEETVTDELGLLAGSLDDMAAGIERTVAELAKERARFKTVLEGMSEGVVAINSEHLIRLMNPAARELFGCDSPEGRHLSEVVEVPGLDALISEDEADSPRVIEFDVPGSPNRVMVRATKPRRGRGRVLAFHDVTEIRRLETVRRDFVANVSHELRTPVSVVQANAETLLDGAIDDKEHARPLLEALHRNAERMARLIADLLDLSRLESGRYELSSEPVAIADVARRAVDAVEKAAADKQTAIRVQVADDVSAYADPKALDQVLVNLLENAIKYTPETSEVTVSAEVNDKVVRISVADNGPGIPAAHRARIFERFYRVDPGRSRNSGGTGLGLAIVKHLAESMNGRASFTAGDPHGATFLIELPVA